MSKPWIDFKALRANLRFEDVLRHYGVEIHRKGEQHHGFCPLPNHDGKRNSQSFSANLERGIFQCFGCHGKGNVLDFAVLMEKADPKDGEDLRRVAIMLQEKFCPPPSAKPAKATKSGDKQAPKKGPDRNSAPIINPPLDFELTGLDPNHKYLKERGFDRETIEYFGLGYCSRGFLKDRVAIPLHDHDGHLIGYAGRMADDSAINEDNPKYLFPSKREREGKTFEFRKSVFLYNGFNIQKPVRDLIVVEGFTSVWWLHQNGLKKVVAVMGSECSDAQTDLILSMVQPNGHVWCMPDGDKAGKRLAESLLLRISPHRFVRWMKLDDGIQPTDITCDTPSSLFGEMHMT